MLVDGSVRATGLRSAEKSLLWATRQGAMTIQAPHLLQSLVYSWGCEELLLEYIGVPWIAGGCNHAS